MIGSGFGEGFEATDIGNTAGTTGCAVREPTFSAVPRRNRQIEETTMAALAWSVAAIDATVAILNAGRSR